MVQFGDQADIPALLQKVEQMPINEKRLQAALRVAEITLKADDIYWAYYAHYQLCFTAMFLNKRELVIETFSWCLDFFDHNPGAFEANSILWLFKYVIECSAEYAVMSLREIENLLSEYKRRLEENNYSLRTYFYYKSQMNMWTGNIDSSIQDIIGWKKYGIDEMSDCPACECCYATQMLSISGFYEEAIQEALPVLDNQLTCEEEPMRIMSVILDPLMRLERYDKAAYYHKQGYRLLKRKPFLVFYLSMHIQYLVMVGHMDEAMQLFSTHKTHFFAESGHRSKYYFYLSILFLFQSLQQTGIKVVSIKFPKTFSLYQKKGEYSTIEIEQYFEKIMLDLAVMLDKRNNCHYFETYAKDFLGR